MKASSSASRTARWTTQFAISNGTGGAPEVDDGKQIAARTEFVQLGAGASGASALLNDTDAGDRMGAGAVRRVRTGPGHLARRGRLLR